MSNTVSAAAGPLPPSLPEVWEPLLRFQRLSARSLERLLRIEAATASSGGRERRRSGRQDVLQMTKTTLQCRTEAVEQRRPRERT